MKSSCQWRGNFVAHPSTAECDFFGMPFKGPFYVAAGGMHNFPLRLGEAAKKMEGKNTVINVHPATRVSKLVSKLGKWHLEGVGGHAAFHDTKESIAKRARYNYLNDGEGYDLVVLTDISSTSFDSWHRASAGVPDSFSKMIKEKVGSRVPLFAAMVAFEMPLPVNEADSITFSSRYGNDCWFAAKTNSKPGFDHLIPECWTIVSTASYAAKEIKNVPMQDEKTGDFLPQEPGYLKGPATHLLSSFLKAMNISKLDTPKILHLSAQRWGSALPAARHVATDKSSPTRKYIGGVAYDIGQCALAPTKIEGTDDAPFCYDKTLNLLQIGDMVSNLTVGMESAVVSAVKAAAFVASLSGKKK